MDDLVHILSVASLTKIPPLVEVVVGRIYSITGLRAENRSKLKAILLRNSLAPSTDKIKDLLSIARYYECYFVARGDHITKNMWSGMKNDNYEIFYLTVSFALQNFTETYLDNSTFCLDNS